MKLDTHPSCGMVGLACEEGSKNRVAPSTPCACYLKQGLEVCAPKLQQIVMGNLVMHRGG